MAVKQYGSIEKFTKAMEENQQHFLENGPGFTQKEADEAVDKTDTLTKKLTADLSKEAGSDEVQKIAGELVLLINESNGGMDMGSSYWSFMVNNYMTNPAFQEITDRNTGKVHRSLWEALKVYFGME